MSEINRTEMTVSQERAVLVGVVLPKTNVDPRDPLGELASLVKTAGGRVVAQLMQNRQRPDAGTYIGSGKAIEIAKLAKENNADVIVFDNDLAPSQIGALEKVINTELNNPKTNGIKVIDRSELILDIFATRAKTREAKLQVELAQMEYTYPRLARMWGHLERLAGGGGSLGIGTRGPGETQLEIDRRLVRKRISDLEADIVKIHDRKSRLVQKRNSEHFTVCVVGYTNAGKSTLFNTLTSAGTYADDKLFATLDTKTRGWRIERGTEVMLSDTVGFVRDLPHNLVASFRATLEEAVHADLLLHVLDVGHPHAQVQFDSVHTVLDEIGAKNKPEILLLNKIDTPEGESQMPFWRALHPGALAISAKTGAGLSDLAERVYQVVRGSQSKVTLKISVTNGKLLSFVESHTRVLDRELADDSKSGDSFWRITAIVGKTTLSDLERHPDDIVESACGA